LWSGRTCFAKERAAQAAKSSGSAEAKAQTNKRKIRRRPARSKQEGIVSGCDGGAGFKNLTVDELISMKIQGVTPAYVKEVPPTGVATHAGRTRRHAAVQGITPEYIREMRKFDSNLNIEELIGMKVAGSYAGIYPRIPGVGAATSADDVIGMKVQGVTPSYVKEMRATGLNQIPTS